MLSPKAFEVLEELKKEEALLIVEGKKDEKALRYFGFKNIVRISGKSLEKVVEEVISFNPTEVAILTDFDDEGKKIAINLSNLLSLYKIKLNYFIRKKIKSLKINKIEELNSFTKLMEDDQNGKTCSIYHKIFNRSRIFSRRNSRKARRDRCYIWSNGRALRSRHGFEGAAKDR